jgi:hypothetical protein
LSRHHEMPGQRQSSRAGGQHNRSHPRRPVPVLAPVRALNGPKIRSARTYSGRRRPKILPHYA